MPLETATYIDGLVATNPPGTDDKSQGDDHLRLIKSVLKNTFPNVASAVTQSAETLTQGLVPPGAILPFGSGFLPDGYLWCDGSAVSRTTYAALFTALGTGWGAGDGVNTFNVPDMSAGFPRGTDAGGGIGVGSVGGFSTGGYLSVTVNGDPLFPARVNYIIKF